MKLETARLRPAPGRRVCKPDGTPLAAEGEVVEITSFWRRRLADQDVLQSKGKKP